MSQASQMIDEPPPATAQSLRLALMESRQRWRQFGAIATDLAFETDTMGNLTFVAPDTVLGWRAADLLGRPARQILADVAGPDPFCATVAVNRRHTWLRSRQGDQVCMALSAIPMHDGAGLFRGTRGTAVDVTQEEAATAAAAASLRRSEVLDHVLSRVRQEVVAPRMMQAMLESIVRALGSPGAAVLDLMDGIEPGVLHGLGEPPPPLGGLLPTLVAASDEIRTMILDDHTQVLACPCSTRFGERAALIAWRPPGARVWDSDDLVLAGSICGVMRIVLEHEAIQRELARQARTDPLTSLLNRRAFLEEATRRIERLQREGVVGTLMFLDLDRLKQLNDRCGHEAGDAALSLMAALLQRTFRPADLVARLGGDEFAVWLDGADSLTAAERAEDLRLGTPAELAHLTAGEPLGIGVSIGIATREAYGAETLEQLIQRADQAMYEAKRAGRGAWRVSQDPGVQ